MLHAIRENLPVAEPLQPDPPDWAAMLAKVALGDLLAVVAQAARVIAEAAPDAVFRRAIEP